MLLMNATCMLILVSRLTFLLLSKCLSCFSAEIARIFPDIEKKKLFSQTKQQYISCVTALDRQAYRPLAVMMNDVAQKQQSNVTQLSGCPHTFP